MSCYAFVCTLAVSYELLNLSPCLHVHLSIIVLSRSVYLSFGVYLCLSVSSYGCSYFLIPAVLIVCSVLFSSPPLYILPCSSFFLSLFLSLSLSLSLSFSFSRSLSLSFLFLSFLISFYIIFFPSFSLFLTLSLSLPLSLPLSPAFYCIYIQCIIYT